jgi:hypothetical protein
MIVSLVFPPEKIQRFIFGAIIRARRANDKEEDGRVCAQRARPGKTGVSKILALPDLEMRWETCQNVSILGRVPIV